MDIQQLIGQLEAMVEDPCQGLPEDLFLFISRIIPMVNVDLLIQNPAGQSLLTWRDDGYEAPGWHLPGGILRFKEPIARRIQAVAATELGARVRFDQGPLAVNEIRHPTRKVRGHFISLLYRCVLESPPEPGLQSTGSHPLPGQWAWHCGCPAELLAVHDIYRPYL